MAKWYSGTEKKAGGMRGGVTGRTTLGGKKGGISRGSYRGPARQETGRSRGRAGGFNLKITGTPRPYPLSPGMGGDPRAWDMDWARTAGRKSAPEGIADENRMIMDGGSWHPDGLRGLPDEPLRPLKPDTPKISPEQQKAIDAVDEARRLQEESKESALGYYDELETGMAGREAEMKRSYEASLGRYGELGEAGAGREAEMKRSYEASLGYLQPIQAKLAGMRPELISRGQQAQMEGTRRAQLGAYGQNLAGMHADPHSGVQGAQRAQIGMGIAGRQANLPIELQLEVGRANRASTLGLYGAQAGVAGAMGGIESGWQGAQMGMYGQQAGRAGAMAGIERGWQGAQMGMYGAQAGIATGKAGIQQSYQYDPGLSYLQSLGYNTGYQGQSGVTSGGLGSGGIPQSGMRGTPRKRPAGQRRRVTQGIW